MNQVIAFYILVSAMALATTANENKNLLKVSCETNETTSCSLDNNQFNQHQEIDDFEIIHGKQNFDTKKPIKFSIDCLTFELKFIPKFKINVLRNFGLLSMTKCPLQRLTKENFTNFESISRLDIIDCRLIELASTTFFDLKKLTSLSLAKNYLSEIDEHLFAGLTKLAWLDVSENQLQVLPESLFANNTKLQQINFSKNRLKIIYQFVSKAINKFDSISFDGNDCIDGTFLEKDKNLLLTKARDCYAITENIKMKILADSRNFVLEKVTVNQMDVQDNRLQQEHLKSRIIQQENSFSNQMRELEKNLEAVFETKIGKTLNSSMIKSNTKNKEEMEKLKKELNNKYDSCDKKLQQFNKSISEIQTSIRSNSGKLKNLETNCTCTKVEKKLENKISESVAKILNLTVDFQYIQTNISNDRSNTIKKLQEVDFSIARIERNTDETFHEAMEKNLQDFQKSLDELKLLIESKTTNDFKWPFIILAVIFSIMLVDLIIGVLYLVKTI